MGIERVIRFQTSDGVEHRSLEEAQAHEDSRVEAGVYDEVGAEALIADPLSARAQAFEQLGNDIRKARYALPGGKRFERKRHPLISPEAAIDLEKLGDVDDGNTVTIDDVMGTP